MTNRPGDVAQHRELLCCPTAKSGFRGFRHHKQPQETFHTATLAPDIQGCPPRKPWCQQESHLAIDTEQPRSPSLQMPLLVTSTLAGFTSKCNTFISWQWTRALVTLRRRKIICLTALRHSQPEQQPPRASPCLNVSPFSQQGGGEGSCSQHTP